MGELFKLLFETRADGSTKRLIVVGAAGARVIGMCIAVALAMTLIVAGVKPESVLNFLERFLSLHVL